MLKIDSSPHINQYGDERRIRLSGCLQSQQLATLEQLFLQWKFDMLSCSYWENHAPWFVTRRRLADIFCIFVQGGELQVEFDAGRERLTAGDALLLPAGKEHAFGLPEGGQWVRHVIFHLQLDGIGLTSPVDALNSPIQRGLAIGMENELESCVTLYDAENPLWRSIAENLFRGFLLKSVLQGTLLLPELQIQDPRVLTSLEFVRRNFSSAIGVLDMAAAAGLKEVRFRTLFKRQCGITPVEYLRQLRLQQAIRLLNRSDLQIEEIAAACGFGSACYFGSFFRSQTGISPGQYRARQDIFIDNG